MKYEDASWMRLCDALRDAWSAEDWCRWYASCNVPVPNEWLFSDDNSGERKTLLKTLSYKGAIRSRWPRANLDLQEYCSLSQQQFIDPTNAVYAFTLRHVWRTARLPTQDVNILGDLVQSVLGFWWVLEVSEMMAMQKYSESMRSFLSNLEFAVTSVYYWRSQDGPWFQKIYDSSILCHARSYASDAAALDNL